MPAGLDSRMFEHDMPKLEKVAAVLRYDRSGSGRSPAATGPIDSIEELWKVSNEAFDGRPCALVGSSYGGPVAELGAKLDQLALVQSFGAEAALDVGFVVIRLGLGDAAQAVGVHG